MVGFIILLPTMLIYFIAFFNTCKHKFSMSEIAVGILSTYIICAVAFTFFASSYTLRPASDVLGNLILVACLTLIAYKKSKNVLLSGYHSLFSVVTCLIGETFTGLLVLSLLGSNYEAMRGSLGLTIAGIGIAVPICYALSRYAGNILHKSYTQLSSIAKERFITYACALSALTYLLTQVNFLLYRIIDDYVLLASINILIVTSIFFAAMVMIVSYARGQQAQLELILKDKTMNDLSNHNKHIELAYDEMRSYRHDHLYVLGSLLGFAEDDKLKELKQQLTEVIGYSTKSLEKLENARERLMYLHIPELKGLLSAKVSHALGQDINVEVDILQPIDNINVNRLDLCRMVGIMMDNAIEELSLPIYDDENIQKKIKIGIVRDTDGVAIVCSNTYKTLHDTNKMFEKNYSTKGINRGIGLYTLKQLSEQCNNTLLSVRVENNEFTLVLTIEHAARKP